MVEGNEKEEEEGEMNWRWSVQDEEEEEEEENHLPGFMAEPGPRTSLASASSPQLAKSQSVPGKQT